MKSLRSLTILTLSLFVLGFASSCSKEEVLPQNETPELAASGHSISLPSNPCGTPEINDLRDAGGTVHGSVELMNDKNDLYLNFQMNPGWFIADYKVYTGLLTGLPKDDSGTKIMVEKFPYTSSSRQPANSAVARIPLATMPNCPQMLVYVRAVRLGFLGNVVDTKDVWLDGTAVLDGFYHEYCIQACPSSSLNNVTR